MWLPQPRQVGLPHFLHVALLHIVTAFLFCWLDQSRRAPASSSGRDAGDLLQVRYPPSRFFALKPF